ncbi:hypothetical protein F4604DRAFT_1885673 [Suillus subluteus]|nr:hypothetical protein F4604DRAFT_1885673 [Suillus subluteus]
MIEEADAENSNTPDVDFSLQDTAPGHVHLCSSPDVDHNPTLGKNCRVSVEEVDDKDATSPTNNGRGWYFEPNPGTGWAQHEGETVFERRLTREEWSLGQWLVKNLGQRQTDEFLKLPITQNRLKLPFHNNWSFLQTVDELPHGPAWSCKKVTVRGNCENENGELLEEEVELWSRDPVECVKELIGNPSFKADMAYTVARAYSDPAGEHRVIDEMWTADWWGEKQKALPDGATIAPIILASDKTSLSQFQGDKSAWPVYMSIGNIAKAKRHQVSARATVLIGYLPAGKLDCFTPDARSLARYRLFHHCMSLLLYPLIVARNNGVDMVCADSWIRCVYPILVTYIADFPEQCLVACCKENRCPKCLVGANERGEGLDSVMRDPESTKNILERRKNGQHPLEFKENGLHAVYKPFWADMPHADIFMAFTPDLLHQIHKGVFKDHLVKWCVNIIREEEVDTRFKAIPDYPGLRHFKKGISTVKQWTGSEHKEMQQVFVGLLTGAVPSRVLVVARSILDFLYYAVLQIHTVESLEGLQTALAGFHANKDVLKELAIREHFNIPKLHQLTHYVQSISLFSAADGFNTELPERLHIDFAKDAYPVFLHSAYLDWLSREPGGRTDSDSHSDLDSGSDSDSSSEEAEATPAGKFGVTHVLAKTPAHPHQSVQKIVGAHGATDFLPALQSFLRTNLPQNTLVPGVQDHFDLHGQVVIVTPPSLQVSEAPMRRRIRASPERLASGCKPGGPARFDMALIRVGPRTSHLHTLDGLRVGQVRMIFCLPPQFGEYSRALAYIEWFTPFRAPDPSSRMRQVSHSTHQLRRNVVVIHVDDIVRPCHLIPKMGESVDLRSVSGNAYEAANDFYFNDFIDGEMFCASVTSS